MRKFLLGVVVCMCVSICAMGGVIGYTSPGNFTADTVDWCANYGCDGSQYASPQTWISTGSGNTGLIGLVDTQEGFYTLQQSVSWNGNFASGMGLIYNGSNFGNIPTAIAVNFDQPQFGVGAWIQSDFYGPFTATLTLFDINFLPLGSFTAEGVGNNAVGTTLFFGAINTDGGVYAATFNAMGPGGAYEPAFAIGTMRLASPIPEPASLLLIAPVLGGLALLRRRRG